MNMITVALIGQGGYLSNTRFDQSCPDIKTIATSAKATATSITPVKNILSKANPMADVMTAQVSRAGRHLLVAESAQ